MCICSYQFLDKISQNLQLFFQLPVNTLHFFFPFWLFSPPGLQVAWRIYERLWNITAGCQSLWKNLLWKPGSLKHRRLRFMFELTRLGKLFWWSVWSCHCTQLYLRWAIPLNFIQRWCFFKDGRFFKVIADCEKSQPSEKCPHSLVNQFTLLYFFFYFRSDLFKILWCSDLKSLLYLEHAEEKSVAVHAKQTTMPWPWLYPCRPHIWIAAPRKHMWKRFRRKKAKHIWDWNSSRWSNIIQRKERQSVLDKWISRCCLWIPSHSMAASKISNILD